MVYSNFEKLSFWYVFFFKKGLIILVVFGFECVIF